MELDDMANSINDLDSSSRGREYLLDRSDILVEPGLNIRTDYGDLDDLSSVVAGIKQPLIGYMKDGKFLVCDGHRRLTKYDQLQCDYKIPCKLDQGCATREGQIFLALGMASAKNLTMLEKAHAYKQLQDEGLNLDQIVEKSPIKVTITSVRDCLSLLDAPETVQDLIKNASISPTEALEVMRSEGSNAAPIIEKAVEIAATMGKSKATAKHVKLAKAEPKTFNNGYDGEPIYDPVQENIEFLRNCNNFDDVRWEEFAPSVLKKLVAQLTVK